MALNDIQISGLPNIDSLTLTDLFVLQRGGTNFNVTTEGLLAPHADLQNNPHNVQPNQIGLGNVSNFTISDVLEDESSQYASSKAVFDGVSSANSAASTALSIHTEDLDNPHEVTKSQIGLSNVQNYASTSTIGTSTSLYATQLGLQNARDSAVTSSNALTNTHILDLNNPHQVNKTDVGLSLVQNYSANSSHTSTSSTTYATSLAVSTGKSSAITASNAYTDVHKDNLNNPHQVNKADVGLSVVPNWAAGSSTLGSGGSTFPSEYSVRGYVDPVIANLYTHEVNLNNPHQVNKEDVLLGNVSNYAISDLIQNVSTQYASSKAVYSALTTMIEANQDLPRTESGIVRTSTGQWYDSTGYSKGSSGNLVLNFANTTTSSTYLDIAVSSSYNLDKMSVVLTQATPSASILVLHDRTPPLYQKIGENTLRIYHNGESLGAQTISVTITYYIG